MFPQHAALPGRGGITHPISSEHESLATILTVQGRWKKTSPCLANCIWPGRGTVQFCARGRVHTKSANIAGWACSQCGSRGVLLRWSWCLWIWCFGPACGIAAKFLRAVCPLMLSLKGRYAEGKRWTDVASSSPDISSRISIEKIFSVTLFSISPARRVSFFCWEW